MIENPPHYDDMVELLDQVGPYDSGAFVTGFIDRRQGRTCGRELYIDKSIHDDTSFCTIYEFRFPLKANPIWREVPPLERLAMEAE